MLRNDKKYIVKKPTWLIVIILFLISTIGHAADPILVMVSLKPPYSPFLNEYASEGSSNIQITFLVKDSRMIDQAGRIQFFLEKSDVGIVMQTSENANIPPVFFNGGITEILTGADLAPYFIASNNVFSGIDENQYLSTGRIPDGQYRIGFRVVDARRPEVEYSQIGFSQPAWFLLNDPPMLNVPQNKNIEQISELQNIKLEWFPRHLGSLNSAFTVQYQLEIFAIRVTGIDPNQLVLSMQPNFTDVVMNTNYFINNESFLLEPGVEYAWRVKATTQEGLNVFQNNGYSEVFTFIYGSPCPVPSGTGAVVLSAEKALITWNYDPGYTSVQARYRLKDQRNAVWHSYESFSNQIELGALLTAGKEYEYQLRGKCSENLSDYTSVEAFSTPFIPERTFECGETDSIKTIGMEPKEELIKGDYIYSGNFPIKIIEATGSNGKFSGTGQIMVPFLSNLWINVKFENVFVDIKSQAYGGVISSVTDMK